MKPTFLIATIVSVSALAAGAFAQDMQVELGKSKADASAYATPIPTDNTDLAVREQANITFVTGGVGDDERQAIEATGGSYNVHITSASTKGAFVGDMDVVIRNKAGDELVSTTAGPLLYVQLPAGSYTLDAKHDDETQTKTITVSKKKAITKLKLSWKNVAIPSDE